MLNLSQVCDDICTKGYAIIESFLPENDYQTLLSSAQLMQNKGLFRSAKVGRHLSSVENSSIRSDKIAWLDNQPHNTAIEMYFSQINRLANYLNQSLFLGLSDFETHFAIYPPGSFYRLHIDQFHSTQERRISCVYYLNQQWQEINGGQFKLYNQDNDLLLSLLPSANRFICFKSELPHEVCETKMMRYSIAGWMKVRRLPLNNRMC